MLTIYAFYVSTLSIALSRQANIQSIQCDSHFRIFLFAICFIEFSDFIVHIYIYIYVCVCVCVNIYIYI